MKTHADDGANLLLVNVYGEEFYEPPTPRIFWLKSELNLRIKWNEACNSCK